MPCNRNLQHDVLEFLLALFYKRKLPQSLSTSFSPSFVLKRGPPTICGIAYRWGQVWQVLLNCRSDALQTIAHETVPPSRGAGRGRGEGEEGWRGEGRASDGASPVTTARKTCWVLV